MSWFNEKNDILRASPSFDLRCARHLTADPRSQMMTGLASQSGDVQVVPQFSSQYLDVTTRAVRNGDSERESARFLEGLREEAKPSGAISRGVEMRVRPQREEMWRDELDFSAKELFRLVCICLYPLSEVRVLLAEGIIIVP